MEKEENIPEGWKGKCLQIETGEDREEQEAGLVPGDPIEDPTVDNQTATE